MTDKTGDARWLSDGPIVVGVDGSAHGRRAVDWALEEARARHCGVLLILAYDYGVAPMAPIAYDVFSKIEEGARQTLDEEVAYAARSGVPVEGRLEFGPASRALIEASAGAPMLVVGGRGRGGFAGALLGSVSTACVHHALCPVVVVPSDRRRRTVQAAAVA
ncbi:MAG TPA: universal stress protein [Acidimicrobiales bacterium]|nr:universal stress protein [Acidimicrobiales bacterium]